MKAYFKYYSGKPKENLIATYFGNIKNFSKEKILSMKSKDIKEKEDAVIRYFIKNDKDFRIKVYKKRWIQNNELFYDISELGLPAVKFSLEELKEILSSKQFDSKARVMGGSQQQRENAINHLLKTQELTLELMTLIFEKYKDDDEMLFSTIKFMTKSKKVVLPESTGEIPGVIDKLAEMIVMNPELHELVRSLKKRIDTTKLTDDTVKLLLECIE